MNAAGHAVTGRAPGRADGAPVPAAAPDATAVVLQAASLLLDYPGPASDEDLGLVAAALAELPAGAPRRALERFISEWRRLGPSEREQDYVATFELDGAVTLYLTEGMPRTSRERGAALLDLRRTYARLGAEVRGDELPDYLPLMLEVAAHVPDCRALLAGERQALVDLATALDRRQSSFALVVRAVLSVLPAREDGGRS